MKLLLISSSPRKEKSATFALAKEVLKGTKNMGASSEIVHLCDYKLDFCKSCGQCHKKPMDCPTKDKTDEILQKILEADGIILASPNYVNQVTGSMKVLFDRSSHFIHCKRLLDKYVVGAVTSGSGRDETVLDYMKYYANICGAQYCGGISSKAMSIEEKREEAIQSGKTLVSDIKGKKAYPDQLEIIKQGRLHFGEIIKARKAEWPGEYHYWLDQGWL